jgi:trimeric autotransporter adhesin
MSVTLRQMVWVLSLALCACVDAKGQEPTPELDLLQVLPFSSMVAVGDTVQLGAQRVRGPAATNVTSSATWSSDNEAIVKVSFDEEKGAVATAVAPGMARVSAQAEGMNATALFVVQSEVSAIQLDVSMFELAAGTDVPLGAVLITADGQKRAFDEGSWGTSDPAVASVDADGVVTGLAAGTANITLVRAGFSSTQSLAVRSWQLLEVTAQALDGSALTIDQTSTLRVLGQFGPGKQQDVTALFSWSVEVPADPAAAADLEENGPIVAVSGTSVQALRGGAARVLGAGAAGSLAEGKSVALDFTVVDAMTKLSALRFELPERISVHRQDVALTYFGMFGSVEVASPKVDLTVEPADFLYIDSLKGLVVPLAAGTATITASADPNGTAEDEADDITASIQVVVTDAALSALEIQLAAGSTQAVVAVDQVLPLTARASFGAELLEDASSPALWVSDDPSIAAVSNVRGGRVVGRSPGQTTIRATYLGQNASLPLTVSP